MLPPGAFSTAPPTGVLHPSDVLLAGWKLKPNPRFVPRVDVRLARSSDCELYGSGVVRTLPSLEPNGDDG